MSLDISGSKFVKVYNPTIKVGFSEKILICRLVSSEKTNKPKVDRDTGEVIVNSEGEMVMEREYSNWEGYFVGNAFEAAKGLSQGETINITKGWISNTTYPRRDGSKVNRLVVWVSDFEPLNVSDGEDEIPADDAY